MPARKTVGELLFTWTCLFFAFGFAFVTIFFPIRYFVRQIMWTKTEALLLEQLISEDGQSGYETFEFKDSNGIRRVVTVDMDDSIMKTSDDKYYLIYYNPRDPAQSIPVNHGLYMMLLFAPFAWGLWYFSLPDKYRRFIERGRSK